MSKKPRLTVTQESPTGRNERFQDTRTGQSLTRRQVVQKIESGTYNEYHVREINGVKTPVSNPDRTKSNNLDDWGLFSWLAMNSIQSVVIDLME